MIQPIVCIYRGDINLYPLNEDLVEVPRLRTSPTVNSTLIFHKIRIDFSFFISLSGEMFSWFPSSFLSFLCLSLDMYSDIGPRSLRLNYHQVCGEHVTCVTMSRVIRWDSSWMRWPDQCRTISGYHATYRPGRVLELTISIEAWLHPEEEPLSRLMTTCNQV